MIRFALLLTLVGAMLGAAPAIGLAKGQPNPIAMVTLCIDGIAQAVAIDANGQPVKGGHHCPECVATFAADVPVAAAPIRPEQTVTALAADPATCQSPKSCAIHSHARAPPPV